MLMSDKTPKIDCAQCQHYFVTWDASRPHGCHFFGFKSLQSPALSVIESSGEACHAFQLKQRPARSAPTNKKTGWRA